MYYLIYKITNKINNKELIGRHIGNSLNFKITKSSNKFFLEDLKKYGYNFFKKEILKKFEDKISLNIYFNKLKLTYKNSVNSYNYNYKLSEKGIKNIIEGKNKKRIKRLKEKYKDFNKTINILDNHKYIIKKYCNHGDLIISIDKFNKKYSIDNKLYCEKCINEFIEKINLTNEIIKEKQIKLSFLLNHPKHHEEYYIKFYYPDIYKSILIYSNHYKNINFNERLFLFKNNSQHKPKCLCCEKEVDFCKTKKFYNTYCQEHIKIHHTSNKEKEVLDFIKSSLNTSIKSNFLIENKELDIYIPDKKIAIEFNELYWHSDDFKNKEYHYNKWKSCYDKDIKLITIWEDDWDLKKDIVKSIIKSKLNVLENKIYARKCIIKELSYNQTKKFLELNHLQGFVISNINLGLFYNDELVSLMTFGKKRNILKQKSKENEYELLRFCNKLDTYIIGGASKLFKYFIKEIKPHEIISYASCDISDGALYKKLNFKEIKHTGLNYWWVKDKRYHRSNFMKYKLIKEGEDPKKTADQIMRERGYNKIWGNGNILFKWESLKI